MLLFLVRALSIHCFIQSFDSRLKKELSLCTLRLIRVLF